MVIVELLSPGLAMHLKQVRLTALQDAPSAFGSTYARESQFSDEDWRLRARSWISDRSVFYIAMDQGASCGMIGSRVDEHAPQRAWVLSMWVAPTHRRSGLGTRLIDEVERWGQSLGVCELLLNVTSNNLTAQSLYEKCGFVRTGMTHPYENDPALFEYEMIKAIPSG